LPARAARFSFTPFVFLARLPRLLPPPVFCFVCAVRDRFQVLSALRPCCTTWGCVLLFPPRFLLPLPAVPLSLVLVPAAQRSVWSPPLAPPVATHPACLLGVFFRALGRAFPASRCVLEFWGLFRSRIQSVKVSVALAALAQGLPGVRPPSVTHPASTLFLLLSRVAGACASKRSSPWCVLSCSGGSLRAHLTS